MAGWGMAPTMERELPPVASEDEPLVDQLTTFLARKEALNESFGGPWNGMHACMRSCGDLLDVGF